MRVYNVHSRCRTAPIRRVIRSAPMHRTASTRRAPSRRSVLGYSHRRTVVCGQLVTAHWSVSELCPVTRPSPASPHDSLGPRDHGTRYSYRPQSRLSTHRRDGRGARSEPRRRSDLSDLQEQASRSQPGELPHSSPIAPAGARGEMFVPRSPRQCSHNLLGGLRINPDRPGRRSALRRPPARRR